MKHKKVMAIIVLSIISACGAAFLLLGARADKGRDLAELPRPKLSACTNLEHPRLPQRFRAIYLMAPFSTGQLVLGEIVHDGSISATRFTLYGVQRGVADFLVLGNTTYLLPSAETGVKNCTALGDTGWRPLPADWLTKNSRCAGSGLALNTPANWWMTPIKPLPSTYWILSKHSDGTPFRLVFAHSTNQLAALGQFALSHQLTFESLDSTDLSDIALSCQTATRTNSLSGASGLAKTLNAMEHANFRADAEIERLFPELHHRCAPPTEPLWTEKLAFTGMLTPFDFGEEPVVIEVMYDWSVPGQRSRIFPRHEEIEAHDFLLLKAGGYNVTYWTNGTPECFAGLPGAIRPDWSQRAPCECGAQIDAGTPITPDEPIKILSCPLNLPRIALAFYTPSGRPTVFMVTSALGDEGSRSFAVLDYHKWAPHFPVAGSAFSKPSTCPDSPVVEPGMPTNFLPNCKTCHSSVGN